MSASYQDVDEIVVLIDIEDPMTYDPEFKSRLDYGGFTKSSSEFTEENREIIRSNLDEDELTNNKFFIEIYTDKLADFVQSVLYSRDWQRALIFREERVVGPEFEEAVSMNPDELDEECEIAHYYELKTVARMPFSEDSEDDDDDDDEEVDASDLGEDGGGAKLARELDKFPSLFLPESKTLH
jgi:hypothetical protein